MKVPGKPMKSVQLEKGQVSAEDSPGPGLVRELNKEASKQSYLYSMWEMLMKNVFMKT